MLIRIRSKDGNFRFEMQPTDDASKLWSKVIETTIDADISSIAVSSQPRGGERRINTITGTLGGLGLKHGDLIFVSYQPKPVSQQESIPSTNSAIPAKLSTINLWDKVTENAVDIYWRSQPGKLPRGRDAVFCKHGPKGMCDYCMPLEPYDAAYHKEHAIKHLSYHAYLRKITPKQTTSASSFLPPLEPLSYKVKVPCPKAGHVPWPAGICTACQPSAITLQSQPFRMVDHLEIASMDIIDRFLQVWRKTGLQRFGWLIGHYEPYDKVPMGIKAVVEAICEPPQQGELDGLTLGWPWGDEKRIKDISSAASTPLSIVGYVFTDLDPTEEDRTKNVYKRHKDSFYLSSLEAIFAATVQKQHPVASKSSPTGQFASRLVTAVLTATEDGQVDVSAYQVSEQAVAMVEADMIEASVEPGIVRVKEEDRNQDTARYVPDVFFTYKNDYGLEVKKSAKPCFPVEYLIVNVTHGFPQNPSPMFRSIQFSIENRLGIEDQRVESFLGELNRLGALEIQPTYGNKSDNLEKRNKLAQFLSDYHLITFLSETQLLSSDDVGTFMKVVTSPRLLEDSSSLDPILKSDGWQTLITFAAEQAPVRPSTSLPPSNPSSAMDEDIPQEVFDQIAAEVAAARAIATEGSGGGTGGSSSSDIRICQYCTFENIHKGGDCEVCGLPL